MLNFEHLTFAYPPWRVDEAAPAVLQDVSLHLDSGHALTVMGASSTGKSTLCYLAAGLAPRYTGGTVTGRVLLAGQDVIAAPPPAGRVGMLFQDAATQLFNTTVENEVAWGLEAMALPPAVISARVAESLARFGLADLRPRPPWELSGGQQKRLALAALWAMRPRLMVLDEPLGGLDPLGREEVIGALRSLRESGAALLLTTLRPQTARLAERASLLTVRHLSPPEPTAHLLAHDSRLQAAGIVYPPAAWPEFGPGQQRDDPPALELRGVTYRYPTGHVAIHEVSLTVPRGQFVALVGHNGAGKSTLVRHFNGLLRPERGTVRLLGQETASRAVGELARQVSFLFQRPEQQIFGKTVYEEVAYGPRQLRLPDVETRVTRALARFGLEEVASEPPAMLSYGRQRTVTLAALAALETPILVLDEPLVGLDGRGWAQLLAWLVERRAAGTTLVVVTHEMPLASRADRVVLMRGGRIAADGSPDEVLPRFLEGR